LTSIALCPADALTEGASLAIPLPALGQDRNVLLFRRGATYHAYWDRCPHIGVSMLWIRKILMTPDGTHLRCASHDAFFRIADGLCVRGPCVDETLAIAPIRITDGQIWLDLPAAG
jgi:nitrite reductase/ring-hydroxylating ferredoxin subunit